MQIHRRSALECMLWAGTGVLWTVAGGVPRSSLVGSAREVGSELARDGQGIALR